MAVIKIQGTTEKENGVVYEVNTECPPLGVGGMGQVFKGTRIDAKGVRMEVAIKFLFDDLPQHVIERARREASIQIHNENLVEMFGFIQIDEVVAPGVVHQRYHVVSELLTGVVLYDLLKGKTCDSSGVEIPFAQDLYRLYKEDAYAFALYIVKNVLSGVMALHDKGYIHRDIDPSNIMITADGKVKIIDYGIAKQLSTLNTQDQMLTTAGQFMGKATYAAPELVVGDVVHQNKTTDIYAVGILLFQLLTGHLPFDGATHEVLDMQLHKKMPLQDIAEKNIRKVVAKATEKKQIDRFQSAAEFRVALEQLENLKEEKRNENKEINLVSFLQVNKKWILPGTVALFVGIGIIGFVMSTPSANQKTPAEEIDKAAQAELIEKMKNEVIDSFEPYAQIDSVSGVTVKTSALIIQEAVKELLDSAQAGQGVKDLQRVVDKHYRSSSEAAYLLGRLHYKEDDVSDTIQKMKVNLGTRFNRDNRKAHQLMALAVQLDSTSYKALYELGCDYYAGEMRTGEADSRNLERALECFQKGLEFATKANDSQFKERCTRRIMELTQ